MIDLIYIDLPKDKPITDPIYADLPVDICV